MAKLSCHGSNNEYRRSSLMIGVSYRANARPASALTLWRKGQGSSHDRFASRRCIKEHADAPWRIGGRNGLGLQNSCGFRRVPLTADGVAMIVRRSIRLNERYWAGET